MRIAAVHVRIHRRKYEQVFRNPHMSWDVKHAVIAFVETESGVIGLGEAWCDGADPRTTAWIIERDLAPLVIGKRVDQPEALWADMLRMEVMSLKGAALYAAAGALDTAIWDAYGRSLNTPLNRLLGGHRDSVPVYGSGGLYAVDYDCNALANDMSAAMQQGCWGVKIKVAGASLEEDVARICAVRQAIGFDAALMADALFRPGLIAACRLGCAIAPYTLHFFEAPTLRHDIRAWAEVRERTGLALSGPEVESGLSVFRAFLEHGAVDILQTDIAICGGLTEGRRIAALASAFHKSITWHCSGSAISFAANAHAAAAFHATDSIELHLLHQALFQRLWDAGWEISDGRMCIPDLPGLGITLVPDEIPDSYEDLG